MLSKTDLYLVHFYVKYPPPSPPLPALKCVGEVLTSFHLSFPPFNMEPGKFFNTLVQAKIFNKNLAAANHIPYLECRVRSTPPSKISDIYFGIISSFPRLGMGLQELQNFKYFRASRTLVFRNSFEILVMRAIFETG